LRIASEVQKGLRLLRRKFGYLPSIMDRIFTTCLKDLGETSRNHCSRSCTKGC